MRLSTLLFLAGGAAAAFPITAFAQDGAGTAAPRAESGQSATDACACTCAACLEKHGARAAAAAAEIATVLIDLSAMDAAIAASRPSELVEEEPIVEDFVVMEVPMEPNQGTERASEVTRREARQTDDGSVERLERVRIDQRIRDYVGAESPPAERDEASASRADQGYLGIEMSVSDDGVAVARTVDGSPAAEAGLVAGDILFRVGETTVTELADVRGALEGKVAGDAVTIGIMRNGRPERVRVVLGARAVLDRGTRPTVGEAPVEAAPPAPVRARVIEAPGVAIRSREPVVLPKAPPVPALPPEPVAPPREALAPRLPRDPRAPRRGAEEALQAELRRVIERRLRMDDGPVSISITIKAERQTDAAPTDEPKTAERERAKGEAKRPKAEREEADDPAMDAASTRALRRRLAELEAEVGELSRSIERIQREFDRRNPR